MCTTISPQFHQVSSKSDEKQNRLIKSPFFCSEFQSVSRIVKIIHSDTQTHKTNLFSTSQTITAFTSERCDDRKVEMTFLVLFVIDLDSH